MQQLLSEWPLWLESLVSLSAAVLVALLAHYIFFSAAKRFSQRTGSTIDDYLIQHSRGPLRLLLPLFAVFLTLRLLRLPEELSDPLEHLVVLGMIANVAWLIIALTEVVGDILAEKYSLDAADNLTARRILTQISVLRRIVVVTVSVITFAVMLMTFPTVRQLGQSIFASAGLAGLIVGFAARPTLSSVIAGLQIALTQPIRIDDVVIVEGEWGWIEEIGATYVVVRIWDLRRLVVPLSYFIEKPFQNWTRQTADILGTVFVYADYTVPVEEVRQELHRILQGTKLWDGKVWGLQVTNASQQTMELRALMSAPTSGQAWDLRCYVREKLIDFLQQRYPQSLPKMRAELFRVGAAEAPGAGG